MNFASVSGWRTVMVTTTGTTECSNVGQISSRLI